MTTDYNESTSNATNLADCAAGIEAGENLDHILDQQRSHAQTSLDSPSVNGKSKKYKCVNIIKGNIYQHLKNGYLKNKA